jgi:RNA polymerase sigma-70 factor (ECF subfamily)
MDIAPANDANTAAPQTEAEEPDCAAEGSAPLAPELFSAAGHGLLPETLRAELWVRAGAESAGVTEAEIGAALETIGTKHNFGLGPQEQAGKREREAFWRGLRLNDLALALGCALGREAAWQHFMRLYDGPLTRAAVGMTRSAALGGELASALYAELYGVTVREGVRRSPLERYSGRGSLMGWLRAMLAQRQVDHYRKTHRETELGDVNPAAPDAEPPELETIEHLREGLQAAMKTLDAEERFLLSAYYLDAHKLAEVSRVLGVHEATVSRKLKRATHRLRKELLRALEARGLSRRATQEALGTDPRDVDINLRKLLQKPGDRPYSGMEGQE